MIVSDDDPAFWNRIAHHPEVLPHVGLGHEIDLTAILKNPRTVALRAEHGGFIFVQLDHLGRVFELHTLFEPQGWGREVFCAAREAFDRMFEWGCQVVTTYEVEGNWRSRPPRTFRFQPAGDFAPAHALGRMRTWVLTRAAWEASPARRLTE